MNRHFNSTDNVAAVVDLRSERQRRGLTLQDVSRQARIPERYLLALEEGDTTVLPPGPFLQGYRRQYLEYLGIDEEDLVATEAAAKPELPFARLAGGAFLITLIVVLTLKTGSLLLERAAAPSPDPVAAVVAPQVVKVRASEPTSLGIAIDGEPEQRVRVEAGETLELEGKRRVSIDAPDLTRVSLSYNGERVEPLGNLSEGRRLVFIASETP